MNTAIIGIGALPLLFLLWRRFGSSVRSSGRAAASVYLIIGDGSAWSARRVERRGLALYDGPTEYPINVCRLVDADPKLGQVYVFAASALQLADYQVFSELKKKNIRGALFKPAGDLVTMLQMVGAVLVIAAAFYSYTQTSGITATLVKQQAQIEKLSEILSKPLVVAK